MQMELVESVSPDYLSLLVSFFFIFIFIFVHQLKRSIHLYMSSLLSHYILCWYIAIKVQITVL